MKNLKFLIVFLVIVVLAASWMPARVASSQAAGTQAVAGPADSLNIDYVGHTGGTVMAAAIQNDYTYIGEGYSLTILDISVPSSTTYIGRSSLFPYTVSSIAVTGVYAYVGFQDNLRVLNVSDPTDPVEIGVLDIQAYPYAVKVSGNYAYIAQMGGGVSGLRVVDISNPVNPVGVGFLATVGAAVDVDVVGNYAYLADNENINGGLRVVDVSEPNNPIEVGFLAMPSINGVALSGNFAYVADQQNGLRVVDISNPISPTEVGFLTAPGVIGVAVEGNSAYLWVGASGNILIVAVSDPTNPVQVGTASMFYPVYDVLLAGDYAYVANEAGGLRVLDISDSANPIETDSHDAPDFSQAVAVLGDYAYVADHAYGIKVIDVSDPVNPVGVGYYGSPFAYLTSDVAVEGSYAYVAANSSGLRILDVSNPANPIEVGFHAGYAGHIIVEGSYAYVTDGFTTFRVVDISDPANPAEVGSLYSPEPKGLATMGEYAYIATVGLQVVDISDPVQPVELGNYDSDYYAYDVAVSGNYAYLANGLEGLRVIDVTNPISPTEIGFADTPDSAVGVVVEGSYAYVADIYNGLRVFDISDPANPVEAGYYDTPENALGVSTASDLIYVAAQGSGLIILRNSLIPITTTTTILSDAPDPSWVGEPFTITFEVTSEVTSTIEVPTGVVTVTVSDSAEMCSGELVDGFGSCQIALSTPGDYALTANYAGEENFLPSSSASELHTVEMRRVHLPMVLKSPEVIPGLTGKVTENGVTVAGIPLDLRFYNGSSYSTFASTTTDAEGNYLFSQVPALQPGQNYYVRYINDANIDSRLFYWHTADNLTYDATTLETFATFDIADVVLNTPDPGASVDLPVTFTWIPRPASPTDSYEFELFDPANEEPYFYTDPPLGNVSSFTLQDLPNGFEEGVEYGWAISVLSPEGGFGGSYYYFPITFK